MKLLLDNRRCVIQAYELDDDTYNIDDRASMLYFHIGIEFEEGMVYQGVKYFFDKKEIRFSYSTEEMNDRIELFINQHIHELIGAILGWGSEYSKCLELKVDDIVLVKKTFSLAKLTGVYMSKNYFELDYDIEVDYARDELVKWVGLVKEERENLEYCELMLLNLALDKVEYLGSTFFEVHEEFHDGGVDTYRFKVYAKNYTLIYDRALSCFNDCRARAGD
jgi:hypothetical protein